MAKYCPIIKEKVIYTTCLECDDKKCRREKSNGKEKKEKKK